MPPYPPSTTELDRNSLRAFAAWQAHYHVAVFGLCLECTYSGNPRHCPFHEIRKKSLRERILWAQQLSDKRAEQLFLAHLECSQRMMEATISGKPAASAAESADLGELVAV